LPGGIDIRSQRKTDHINLAMKAMDGPLATGFDDVHLWNDSLPDLAWGDIDMSIEFIGKILPKPLLINALTGGTDQGREINRNLARIAYKHDLPMAVGSMMIALEDSKVRDSFTVVREENPTGLLLANLSACATAEQALQAVHMIAADGLQLHLNVPQELAMAEGDRNFKGVVDNIKRIVDQCPVPVIVKEVGFGLSRESINKLYNEGIRTIDIGGAGGTNFLKIEEQREAGCTHCLDSWGIPTVVCLAEAIVLNLPVQIVATGGIRSPLDAVKALAMGADLAGVGGLLLKKLIQDGYNALDEYVRGFLYQMQSIYLMCGAGNQSQMRRKPVLILGRTADWLRARGIDPGRWSNK